MATTVEGFVMELQAHLDDKLAPRLYAAQKSGRVRLRPIIRCHPCCLIDSIWKVHYTHKKENSYLPYTGPLEI